MKSSGRQLITNGIFSSQSAYSLLCGSSPPVAAAWRKIWKFQGPQRYSVLIWQAHWDRLKVNKLLNQRGIEITHIVKNVVVQDSML